MIYFGTRELLFFQNRKKNWQLSATGFTIAEHPFPADCECGVILNPHHFIYNIFDFDKIPWRRKDRKLLVELRLRKVFPDSLDPYHHHFTILDHGNVLSLLIRHDFLAALEEELRSAGLRPVFITNSTVETMNNTVLPDPEPRLVIENDGELNVTWICAKKTPRYIRKFSSGHGEWSQEIRRTLAFVKKNLEFQVNRFILVTNGNAESTKKLEELAALGLTRIDLQDSSARFLPGGRTIK